MTFDELLRRMPKVELHCHLLGTVRPDTWAELAHKHGVAMPEGGDAGFLYAHINSRGAATDLYRDARIRFPPPDPGWDDEPAYSLLAISLRVAQSIRDAADFERIAYESLSDAAATSNTRYREMSFEPTAYFPQGVTYQTMVNGLVAGVRAAETDFGIRARLLVGINREESAQQAVQVVEEMLGYPRPEIVGIGLDNYEIPGPPEKFVEAYALAERHGLHRTAHAAEHDPSARNIVTCLDQLHCERIDHGYFIMQDDEVVRRCRDEGVVFASIFTTSRRAWRSWRRASIKAMVEQGLRVSLASDDPAMFPTTLSQEYLIGAHQVGFDLATLRKLNLNGVDAAWLDDAEKARLRDQIITETDALQAQLAVDPLD
jgi:adenosine deaminase